MLILAGNLVTHNTSNLASPYLYVGILQVVAVYLYLAGKAIVMAYEVVNSSYL
jgi:hypothetical protein